MATDSSWNAISEYSFLTVFANDDTIDAHELGVLTRLALQDHVVDDMEREMLAHVFAHVTPERVEPDVWAQICRFKAAHGIP